MESRNTTKWEYLAQPHIILIAILILVIAGSAIYTAARRVSKTIELSNAATFDACTNFINDHNLCNFAANNEDSSSRSHTLTITETRGPEVKITVIESESASRNKSTTYINQQEVDTTVIYDDKTYVRDEDNNWHFYSDPSLTAEDNTVKYDFTRENSEDVTEFRDKYHYEGKEPCGELSCFKYRIESDDSPGIKTYVWFDDKDYLPRRFISENQQANINTVFDYRSVTIKKPDDATEITEEDMRQFIDESVEE